ncbi:unnamed protein product, partial [Ectocarpus sp. 12 AP-2014]
PRKGPQHDRTIGAAGQEGGSAAVAQASSAYRRTGFPLGLEDPAPVGPQHGHHSHVHLRVLGLPAARTTQRRRVSQAQGRRRLCPPRAAVAHPDEAVEGTCEEGRAVLGEIEGAGLVGVVQDGGEGAPG